MRMPSTIRRDRDEAEKLAAKYRTELRRSIAFHRAERDRAIIAALKRHESVPEIAKRLGVTPNTIYGVKHKGA